MARPPPFPKKPDRSEKLFYHFKISPAIYVLFDSDINTPVSYGSKNLVAGVITQLPQNVTIFYYEIDTQLGWKMKRRYKPDNSTAKEETAKKAVQESTENDD